MEIVTLNRHGADHRRASYANLRQLVPTHVGLWWFKVTFSIIVATFPTYVKSEKHFQVFKTAFNWILRIIFSDLHISHHWIDFQLQDPSAKRSSAEYYPQQQRQQQQYQQQQPQQPQQYYGQQHQQQQPVQGRERKVSCEFLDFFTDSL